MKIFINRKPVDGPWGGGNLLVKALFEHAPKFGHQVTTDLSEKDIDIIFLFDPRQGNSDWRTRIILLEAKKRNIPIIHRVNECDARKGTSDIDKMLNACSHHTTATVFVSNWMQAYHQQYWNCDKQYVVYNGVNQEHFKFRFLLRNPMETVNIVAHHWSDNYLKGFDIYDALDEWVGANSDKFTFTYIGRHRGTFKNTKCVDPLFGKELGFELSKHDVYVSASRFDPGPNHILEALSCDLPTYVHTDGGGAVEFAGNDQTYSSFTELTSILKAGKFGHNDMSAGLHPWEDCIKQYIKIMERLHAEKN